MAKAMGIVLTGTAIRVGAEFADNDKLNFRMGVAGILSGFFLTGIEKLDERAGVGLAIIFFITAVAAPLPLNPLPESGVNSRLSPIETFTTLWKENAQRR